MVMFADDIKLYFNLFVNTNQSNIKFKLNYIRDTSRNKKLWQTIDKLRGKSNKAKLECKLYDCEGKLLSKEEADTEIEEF